MKHLIFDCDKTLIDPDWNKKPYKGVSEVLNILNQNDYNLYVWTMRDEASLLEILKQNAWDQLFKNYYAGFQNYPKPHSKSLEYLVHGVFKRDILVIGDGIYDIQGAKNYGVSFWGVLWSGTDPNLFKNHGIQTVLNSPHGILENLKLR